jgi:hypothetical protein
MITPSLGGRMGLFEDEVVSAPKGQKVVDRKPGLSATDDDGVHLSGHEMSS